MLRQCTAFLLLLAFAVSTFSRVAIVVDFYANQNYIAQNLCENRDKPMMHCCGRCQLRKRLAQQDAQDKNAPERKVDNKQEVLFHEDLSKLNAEPLYSTVEREYASLSIVSPVDRSLEIFHPPA